MTSSRKNENLIWNIQTELTNTGTDDKLLIELS